MNEAELTRFVRSHLDASARSLPDHLTGRLAQAREAALARKRTSGLRVALAGVSLSTGLWPFAGRAFAGLAALLVLLGVLSYAHSQRHIAQIEDIDSAILTGDLPLEAYMDKDFNKWLRGSGAF